MAATTINNFQLRLIVAFGCVAPIFLGVTLAVAQDEYTEFGRGYGQLGQGPGGLMFLLANDQIMAEIKLTEKQKSDILEAAAQSQQQLQEIVQRRPAKG